MLATLRGAGQSIDVLLRTALMPNAADAQGVDAAAGAIAADQPAIAAAAAPGGGS